MLVATLSQQQPTLTITTKVEAADAAGPPPSYRVSQAPLPEGAPYVARTKKWALVAVVVASFVGAVAVAGPLWIPIVVGVVMATSMRHPYGALCRKLPKHKSLAAGLVTLTCGLLVAAVGAFVLLMLTNELLKVVAYLNAHGSSGTLEGLIGTRSAHAIERLGVDTTSLFTWARKEIEAAATFFATTAAVVLRTTSEALLGLIVALFTMYYVLIEGSNLARRIESIAPLEPRHTRALLVEARDVGRTAFIGTLATAVVQGVLAGIGYAILGVPEPVTWALVTALASFVPVIGTLIVWVPIAGWLFMDGHPVKAVIMAIYGIVIITSLADYVIRPRIVGGRGHGHPLLTLIALLGGIEIFGLAGLIIAPILMSVFVAAFRLYEREMRPGGCISSSPTTSPGATATVTSVTATPAKHA